MWWFLILTVGASFVPVYVMPQGPFPTQAVCEHIQREVYTQVEGLGRTVRLTTCWQSQ